MMLISVLIGIGAAVPLIGLIARWGGERSRSRTLHLIWGAIFLYPVVFTVLDARSVYSGADARLVDDSMFAAVNAAWSTFTLLICAALVVGLLVQARREVVHRLVASRAMAVGLLLFLATTGGLAVIAGSWNRLLGVGLVGAVLVALLMSGEPLSALLGRLKIASRVLIGGSLISAIVLPGWSFVPYGHGGREFFGIGSRLIGLTPSPNYLGIFAVIGVYAEVAHARQNARRPNAVWVLLAAGTCLWSQSRTAYLLLILLVIFFASRMPRRELLWCRIRVGTLLGLLVSSMLVPVAFAFSSMAHSDTLRRLVTGRFGAWDAAIEAFADHPVAGYGPEAFGQTFWNTYGSAEGQTYANGHNMWLDLLATAGLLGGAALLVFVILLLRQAINGSLLARDVTLGAMALVMAQMPLGTPFRLHGLSSNLITVAIALAVVAASDQRGSLPRARTGSEVEEWA